MKKIKKVFVQELNHQLIETEDNGCAKIAVFDGDDSENGMFVCVQSWDDNKEHKDFNQFIGKKVRITIETID